MSAKPMVSLDNEMPEAFRTSFPEAVHGVTIPFADAATPFRSHTIREQPER